MMARGMVTARIAAIQAIASVGVLRWGRRGRGAERVDGDGDRVALGEGLAPSGHGCYRDEGGAGKDEDDDRDRPARPVDSGSRTTSPSSALVDEKARPTATASATAASAASGPAWKRRLDLSTLAEPGAVKLSHFQASDL